MKTLLKKSTKMALEIKKNLIKNLDNLIFNEVDTHYVCYWLKVENDKIPIKIWTINGEDHCRFWGEFGCINLFDLEYTEKEKKILWDKTQADKKQTGEKRAIKMTQMSNDLFFSFDGVFEQVKFTGYDDNDWWTKHKPTSIKEDGKIIWKIDLNKMEAIYKSK